MGLKWFLILGIAYVAGQWAAKGIKVNYTRKILHFSLFLIPVMVDRLFPTSFPPSYNFFPQLFAVMSFTLFISPIRNRVPLIAKIFLAFDRPEDRPHTLLWLTTQIGASIVVLLIFNLWFQHLGEPTYAEILLWVAMVGDGLAEPVGVRFGRHRYRTRGFLTKKKFDRSFEGSAVVLITGLIVMIFYRDLFSPTEFIWAFWMVPLSLTLAEAFSPHTWDTPFMFAVGGLTIAVIRIVI